MKKMVLIDGNSLINRAYYALPPLNNSKGEPVNAVYGFTTMLIKAIGDYKPDYIAVAFDMHAPTFRHKIYSEYKAGRKKMPDDLASQLPILKEMLRLMGICILELETYEADDIIGTMTRRFPIQSIVLTGDRDSLQLINDNTEVYLTKKGLTEIQVCTKDNIKELFGYTAQQVVEYKALAGDSSDNIPGVPGIGEKTALDLLSRFGNLEGVYEHLDELTEKLRDKLVENKDLALLSRQLGTIDCNVPISCELKQCAYTFPFDVTVKRFFIDMAFRSLYKKEELFKSAEEAEISDGQQSYEFTKVELTSMDILNAAVPQYAKKMAVYLGGDILHFTFDGKTEYVTSSNYSLFEPGVAAVDAAKQLSGFLKDEDTQVLLYDAKRLMHNTVFSGITITLYEDV